jgi:hypothetical protein
VVEIVVDNLKSQMNEELTGGVMKLEVEKKEAISDLKKRASMS